MRDWTMALSAAPLLILLLYGFMGCRVLSVCPSVCSCSSGHRVVDCSSRGLTRLPPGLQHNIRSLNLSFNSMHILDGQLSHYGHLRTLDLSYNRLVGLPSALPRSLWDIRAAGNHLRSLDKNDTAYHWNLRVLDLSNNELERVVFINNTLLSLRVLDLKHNRFWTVPTNLPHNLQTVDLSHNFLVQVLPGSLDRLPQLLQLYLHANRFSWLPEGVFDRLTRLEVITLDDNPWACEEEESMTRLLRWAQRTPAMVFGCPCYTAAVCGRTQQEGSHHSSTGSVLWVDRPHQESAPRTAEATPGYQARPALHATAVYQDRRGATESADWDSLFWTSSLSSHDPTQHSSTTVRTTTRPRSSRKPGRETNTNNRSAGALVQTHTAMLTAAAITTTLLLIQ